MDVSADWTEPNGHAPERWKLSLDMVFPDQAAFADVGELNTQGSGIYSTRPGPAMDDALREVLWEVEQYAALQALWRSTPRWSTVGFGLHGLRTRPVETFDASSWLPITSCVHATADLHRRAAVRKMSTFSGRVVQGFVE